MSFPRKLARKLLVSVLVLSATFAVLELGARAWLHWFASEQDFQHCASIGQLRARYGEFGPYRAHRHLGFALAPHYVRGGNRHNALGFRGEEVAVEKPAGTVRIACCGGSTTYGWGVLHDFKLSMPYLLEQALRADGLPVEVINAGCPGWTTLETLVNFETRLLDLKPDWLVVYHGINDALTRMVWPHGAYRGDLSGWLTRDEHVAEASLLELSTFARILLVEYGRIQPHGSEMRIIGDAPPTCHTFTFQAQRRANSYPDGVFRDVPIERMLEANQPVFFERNLRNLLAVAAAHGVRVVLATFAFSREFPHATYIGHPAVQAAIEATNEIVRRLGQETQTEVIDLERELVARELFTDGMHFNEAGNRVRAERFRKVFKSRIG
ncbi:MAG TPA: GDSL-type esterase/lipase family protein [Planctomycetota bacterium]